ncbi:hypothetical protein ACFX2B_000190 [Malus domestica]
MLASVTCRVSFAEITGSLSKRRFQISERHLLFQTCQHLSHVESALRKSRAVCRSIFPDVSASVTYRVSFAEITGNLSKHRFQISKRHLFFQTCQRLSHAHSALRKLWAICQRSLVK